ncbi:hypothetical protein F4781DRAFT_432301 [Annulohypoxylon bovei var. microspora]|nr:hypothetical protein F4781DRAFT_432301 [Annulohypoxylon bovei var. microspora]
MKKSAARLVFALLSWQYASASSIQAGQDDPGNQTYPPCPQDGPQQFLIRNWHSTTYSNTTEVFAFTLHASFSGYTSPCHGERSGEASSGWTAVNHTFVCDRGADESDARNRFAHAVATGDGRLLIGLVDTPEGHFTGTEGDNMTIAAYPEVAHRLPRADCTAASRSAEWEVRGFTFDARVSAGNPWVVPATVASINYDLYNKANDFLINCQAVNDSVVVSPDNPALIDPDTRWPCPISYRDDLFPPEAYPSTVFKFDRSRNELTIEQEWECDDGGRE